jgi:hypothetical protein
MRRLPSRPRLAWRAGPVSLVLAAACSGSTGPASPPKLADAARTVAQLGSVSAPTATRLFLSFTLLAPHFFIVDSAPLTPAAALALPPLGRWSLPRRVPLPTPHAATITGAVIPPTMLGKTFVWDTTAKGSSDPGAPANGVRFVIYAVGGPLPVQPSLPLTPLGYVDLTDRSAGSTAVVGITLVGTEGTAPVTYADYTLSGPAGTIASTLTLAGFVTDGLTRLDLSSALTSTLSALTTHTTADVAAQDVHLVEATSLAGTTAAALTLDLSLTSGGETLRATGSFVADTALATAGGEFAVTVNGRLFATMTLGLHGYSYTAAPGVTLAAADEQAINRLIATSFGLFGLVLVLTIPALTLGV